MPPRSICSAHGSCGEVGGGGSRDPWSAPPATLGPYWDAAFPWVADLPSGQLLHAAPEAAASCIRHHLRIVRRWQPHRRSTKPPFLAYLTQPSTGIHVDRQLQMSAPRRVLRTTTLHSSENVLSRAATGCRSRSFFARATKTPGAQQPAASPSSSSSPSSSKAYKPLTTLQEANTRNLPEVWFNSTFPYGHGIPSGPDKPPDERKVKLGKSASRLLPPPD